MFRTRPCLKEVDVDVSFDELLYTSILLVHNNYIIEGGSSMRFFKRLAFYVGLMLGLVTVATAGTVALTYLFTGKLPSLEFGGEKPEVTLMTPDEVVVLVREKVESARAAKQTEETGGENDG